MTKGVLVRGKNGRFMAGKSGNPAGRPKGSKNVITIQKLMVEEAFRAGSEDDVLEVLKLVVKQAKSGDKVSQKLIWDSNVSKQNIPDEKTTGSKQEIKVHTMNVTKEVIEGDYIDVTEKETNEDTIQ